MSPKNTAFPDPTERFVELILSQLERHDDCFKELQDKCQEFHTEIALLKFKFFLISCVGGAVGGVLMAFIQWGLSRIG